MLWRLKWAGGPAPSLQPTRRPIRSRPAATNHDVPEPVGSEHPQPTFGSGHPQPTPRNKRNHPHDPRHFATGSDGSKPVPRLALRMCSHLLMQISASGRVATDGFRREDCALFTTTDKDEIEALDDHTLQHSHDSRDAAGISLCGVVQKVLLSDAKTITAAATAPEAMHSATVKAECEGLFSHQFGSHYSTFKQAFVFSNKADL